jgi:hypothetical protein
LASTSALIKDTSVVFAFFGSTASAAFSGEIFSFGDFEFSM